MIKKFVFCFFCICVFYPVFSSEENFNSYYRSPFSLGAGYISLSPLEGFDTGSPYEMNDISAQMLFTPEFSPFLQLSVIGGVTSFDSLNQNAPEQWDSSSYYGLGGIRLNRKFSKTFEMGISFSGGAGQGIFSNLYDKEVGTVYQIAQTAFAYRFESYLQYGAGTGPPGALPAFV